MKLPWLLNKLMAAIIILAASIALADVPQMINYHGRLTKPNGQPVADGPYLIEFVIYDAPTNGNELWNSTYQTVQVADGLFEIRLGESPMPPIPDTIFNASPDRWLGITVGTDSEIDPRTRFTSVGYAYHALRADTADFALSPNNGWVDDGGVVRLTDEEDQVGIGTTNPDAKLEVVGNIKTTGGGDLVVSGTATLADHVWINGRLGIGTTTPDGKLQIQSEGGQTTGSATYPFRIRSSNGEYWLIHTSEDATGDAHLSLTNGFGEIAIAFRSDPVDASYINAGNVGIGTPTPDERLTVDGNVHVTGDLRVDGSFTPSPIGWRHSGAQVFSGTAPTVWTDLDLSGYIGTNYALVLIKVKGASGPATHVFRPNGDTDEYWRCSDLSDMGAQGHKGECAEAGVVVAETDGNGIVEWRGQGTNVTLTLLGYIR